MACDLLSALAAVKPEGELLEPRQLGMFAMVLLAGGSSLHGFRASNWPARSKGSTRSRSTGSNACRCPFAR